MAKVKIVITAKKHEGLNSFKDEACFVRNVYFKDHYNSADLTEEQAKLQGFDCDETKEVLLFSIVKGKEGYRFFDLDVVVMRENYHIGVPFIEHRDISDGMCYEILRMFINLYETARKNDHVEYCFN